MYVCKLCYVMLCYVMLCYVMLCYVCKYVCMVCTYVILHVYIYIYISICTYVCIHIITYIFISYRHTWQRTNDHKCMHKKKKSRHTPRPVATAILQTGHSRGWNSSHSSPGMLSSPTRELGLATSTEMHDSAQAHSKHTWNIKLTEHFRVLFFFFSTWVF